MRHALIAIFLTVMTGGAVTGNDDHQAREAAAPALPFAATMTEIDRINLELNLRWQLQRERERTERPPQQADGANHRERVAVFADAGVWHEGVKSIVAVLEAQSIPCRVLDRSRLTFDFLSQFDVLVLPGGWAPLQWAAAGEKGLAAIQAFVENGGRCVAICAGAYLLSKTTRYDEKDYAYPLGLFDGTAVGPVAGLARFPRPGSARLKVTEEGTKRGLAALESEDVYYSGGPAFEAGTRVTVLARYHDNSAAMIVRPVGKGEVILMGAHVEWPASTASGDTPTAPRFAYPLLKTIIVP